MPTSGARATRGGCTNETTGERQCYVPEALAVRDGLLVIEADRVGGGRLPYRSVMFVSARSFSQRYGYFELRARLPRGKGLWPAFWLLPKPTGTWPPEMDVMELFGSDPDTRADGPALPRRGRPGAQAHRSWTGPDFTAGFPTEEMYVLVNLAVGGGETPGDPDATTRSPSRMEVDYVRVWEAGAGCAGRRVARPGPRAAPPGSARPGSRPACAGSCVTPG
jgi:serralysin